jgi:predicted dehydrogenase
MNVCIVGCGLIGKKRRDALRLQDRLIVVADALLERAEALAAGRPEVSPTTDWRAAVSHPNVDAVVVSTTNEFLAQVATHAIQCGKHVLVEKPAAQKVEELEVVVAAAKKRGVCVRVGFNHRFHPAILKAREIFESGALGPLMFVRARYGHGGRIGYDKEWRADPQKSGGGELIDQGVHLIDLARWFLGDFEEIRGFVPTYFWEMPVEDNAFLLLKTATGQAAWLHASCTEWKNLFSFEIYGRCGKLDIHGLGGSYGTERLTFYRMLPEMGPPETTTWEFPGPDTSWKAEFEAFARAVEGKNTAVKPLEDAQAVLRIVRAVYTAAER